jgi:hypothetical protein
MFNFHQESVLRLVVRGTENDCIFDLLGYKMKRLRLLNLFVAVIKTGQSFVLLKIINIITFQKML